MRARPHTQRRRRAGWLVAIALLVGGLLVWLARPTHDEGPTDSAALIASPAPPAAPTWTAPATPDAPAPPAPSLGAVEPLGDPAPLAVAQAAPATPAAPEAEAAADPNRGTLELRLRQACGRPAPGVEVYVQPRNRLNLSKYRDLLTDDNGVLVIDGLEADTSFSFQGFDRMGYSVLRDLKLSLTPGEHRIHTETLGLDLRTVEVRVRDPAGALASGAVVSLTASRDDDWLGRTLRSKRAMTGADGRARITGLSAQAVAVGAWRTGLAPAWLPERPLDIDPLVIELMLGHGRPVEVEVVDALGRLRDVEQVELGGSPVTLRAEHLALGRYRFAALPEGQVTLVAVAHKRMWRLVHDTQRSLARFVVPASGALSVSWTPMDECDFSHLFLFTVPSSPDIRTEKVDAAAHAQGGPVEIHDLAAGDYLIKLGCNATSSTELSARATVQSGVTTAVRLER